MKVLHVMLELKYSGAEIMYVDAAPVFKNAGWELYVMSTSKEVGEYAPFFKVAGYEVIHSPYPRMYKFISWLKYMRKTIAFLKREKIDVVHSHSSLIYWDMAICAWLSKKRSVYTFHNVFKTRWFSYPFYFLLRWTAKNLFGCKFQTISDSVFQNELNRFNNNTTLIYNWYGANRFSPATPEEKELFRKELDIPTKSTVLISVGGCSSVKRHSEIIKALPIILKTIPDCIYLHLGKGSTLLEEEVLVEELGLGKHVRFFGNQSQVRKFLAVSDIYLMPSRFEGIPITTIEALACKIPAILYDVPGLRDFNYKGQNCLIIPEDHKVLAEKVIYLTNNPSVVNQLITNAFNFVNTYFSMGNNVLKVIDLYK